MPLTIQPVQPTASSAGADLAVALKPGAIVEAQVLRVLDANLVRLAIGALTIDAATINPLQQGQVLRLAVDRTADAITLTPLARPPDAGVASDVQVASQDIPLVPKGSVGDAAPANGTSATPLSPQETRVVASAAQAAVPKQSGLSPLFANLSEALGRGKLPAPVATAARELLDLRQTAGTISAETVRAALQSSGLLMESAMAKSAGEVPPNLKSSLLVLKSVLTAFLADASPAKPSATFDQTDTPVAFDADMPVTRAASRPGTAASSFTSDSAGGGEPLTRDSIEAWIGQTRPLGPPLAAGKNLLAMQLLAGLSDRAMGSSEHASQGALPPPFRNGAPSPQPVAEMALPPSASPPDVARQLLAETDGALARQTLLQVASLPDRIDQQTLRSDPAQPRWNFEVPFAMPHGTAMAQFEVARDGSGSESDPAQRSWRARFSLDIEPAGPVHALITYGGETTHVKIWAERSTTAARVRAKAESLNAALNQANLHAAEIVIAEGAPTQARAPSAGHFLNRAT